MWLKPHSGSILVTDHKVRQNLLPPGLSVQVQQAFDSFSISKSNMGKCDFLRLCGKVFEAYSWPPWVCKRMAGTPHISPLSSSNRATMASGSHWKHPAAALRKCNTQASPPVTDNFLCVLHAALSVTCIVQARGDGPNCMILESCTRCIVRGATIHTAFCFGFYDSFGRANEYR